MHTLIARKTQTSKEPRYIQECNPNIFYCYTTVPCRFTGGVQDLEVGKASCGAFCPEQNICLKPDRRECTIGLNSKGEDPLHTATWDERAPNLLCVYDLNKIDTADQLNVYKSKFPDNQNENTLMAAFCNKRIISPTCARGLKGKCSRYLDRTDEGRLCLDWLASLPRDNQDAIMRDYCLNNNTLDCKCINRTNDPGYISLKSIGNYFSDNCWYKPCTNSESIYLVPNKLSSSQCATNICQQIIDAHADGQVEISGNVNQINCSFGPNDLNPPKKPEPTPPPHPTPPSPTHWYDFIVMYWQIYLCATVAIILILLF